MAMEPRAALADAKRVVVKIGSRALVSTEGRYESLARQIVQARPERQIVLVSSGAVAAGRRRLGISERPKDTATLQAVAATGQSLLMRTYEDAFAEHGVHVLSFAYAP
ncbi:MAG: hypothetical protein R3A47_10320 [Polyangiales bacterium]